MDKVRQYFWNQLIGIDQYANILLLGDPDETISSRTGRAYLSGRAKWFVRPLKALIDKGANILAGQQNHCVDSVDPGQTYPREIWSWIRG